MITAQTKWLRWLGEESLSGGKIGLHEGGGTFPCGSRRPSQHSMMRWIGFDSTRSASSTWSPASPACATRGQMNVQNTPTTGTVAKDAVLWVETGHPRFHDVNVTWRTGGPTGPVIATGTSRNLDLEPLNLPRGHGRHRRGPRPGRPDRHRLGAQPVDQQRRDGLGLQRLALRADAHVDGRRHDRDRRRARRADITAQHAEHPSGGRATRSSTSRPTTRPTASCRSPGRSTAPRSRTRPTAATSTSASSTCPRARTR